MSQFPRVILSKLLASPVTVQIAVGSDVDNLSLSDRRAETVAVALTEQFGVPAENLTTQGYGEQYLKVQTQGPERQRDLPETGYRSQNPS